MNLMLGEDSTVWFWYEVCVAVGAIVAVWYMVVMGRDMPPAQKPSRPLVDEYGDVQESKAPVPKYLMWTFAGVGVWAVAYLCLNGI